MVGPVIGYEELARVIHKVAAITASMLLETWEAPRSTAMCADNHRWTANHCPYCVGNAIIDFSRKGEWLDYAGGESTAAWAINSCSVTDTLWHWMKEDDQLYWFHWRGLGDNKLALINCFFLLYVRYFWEHDRIIQAAIDKGIVHADYREDCETRIREGAPAATSASGSGVPANAGDAG